MSDRTYTQGFKIQPREISQGEFVQMVREIEQDPVFVAEEVKLAPEPICEGGIVFVSWKGKQVPMYKTIRLPHIYEWPRITAPWTEEDQKMILLKEQFKELSQQKTFEHTFLKAFCGAPGWTAKELNVVARVFKNHGFKVSGLKAVGAVLRREEERYPQSFLSKQTRRKYKKKE